MKQFLDLLIASNGVDEHDDAKHITDETSEHPKNTSRDRFSSQNAPKPVRRGMPAEVVYPVTWSVVFQVFYSLLQGKIEEPFNIIIFVLKSHGE